MEVPFYYSFKEFKENYETDLKKWLEVYTEGEEKDYLTEIGLDYNFFCDGENFVIKDKNKKEIDRDLDNFLQKFGIACFDFLKTFEAIEDVDYNKPLKELLEEYGYCGVANRLEFNERILSIIVRELIYEDADGELYFDSLKFPNFTYAVPKIYNFILNRLVELEKKEEENSNEVEPTTDNFTPLTSTQVDKIGLYRMLGIIDFLKDNNPDMNNSDISRLIVELSSEEMKPESIRPHLTDNIESNKHPFFKSGKIQEYEDILRRYKAKPYKKD